MFLDGSPAGQHDFHGKRLGNGRSSKQDAWAAAKGPHAGPLCGPRRVLTMVAKTIQTERTRPCEWRSLYWPARWASQSVCLVAATARFTSILVAPTPFSATTVIVAMLQGAPVMRSPGSIVRFTIAGSPIAQVTGPPRIVVHATATGTPTARAIALQTIVAGDRAPGERWIEPKIRTWIPEMPERMPSHDRTA